MNNTQQYLYAYSLTGKNTGNATCQMINPIPDLNIVTPLLINSIILVSVIMLIRINLSKEEV